MVRGPGFGKRVEHSIGEVGRSEHLVVGKISYAGQNIGVASAKRKARLTTHMAFPKPLSNDEPASSRAEIGGYALSGVKISCLPRREKREPSWLKEDICARASKRK